jgi:hypothetical protein
VPRYHFDVQDGSGLILDEEGRELPNLEVARREAIKGIRSLISADVTKGTIDLTGQLTLRDATGRTVIVLRFEEAVSITGRWLAPER